MTDVSTDVSTLSRSISHVSKSSSTHLLNQRIRDRNGFRGTIRYVGTVCTSIKKPTFIWYGIEWDEMTRGKHDGSVISPVTKERIRYFQCETSSGGSFVKPKKIIMPTSFLNEIRQRYEEEEEGSTSKKTNSIRRIAAEFDGEEGRQFEVELVGVDKILKRQRLDVLKIAAIDGSNLGYAGIDDEDEDVLGRLCPEIREIHAQETLLGDWNEVARIVRGLPKLTTLNVSKNPLGRVPTGDRTLPFERLKVLVLNQTGTKWNDALALMKGAPNVEELHLCGNEIERLDTTDEERTTRFQKLRALDLSENAIRWKDVRDFAQDLPALVHLVLNNTAVASVTPVENTKPTFRELRSLSICGGNIVSWTSVDALDTFPSLLALKCQRHPLLRSLGPRQQRQHLIARVASLRHLNSSDVRRRERNDAEKIYIKSVLCEAIARERAASKTAPNEASSTDDLVRLLPSEKAREELARAHPRLGDLLKTHGIPASLRGNGADGSKFRGMVSLILKSMATVSIAGEPRKQRVPVQMKVGDLKKLCGRFFNVRPDRQVLKYREADDFAVPTTLNDDESSLAYYGIADGGTVFVHDDGDERKV